MISAKDIVLTIALIFSAPLVVAETVDTAHFFENPSALYGDSVHFAVFRNGKPVGEHSVSFSKQEDMLEVIVESNLAVRYLGITMYKYAYTAIEKWRGSQLVSVESTIRENKKPPKRILAQHANQLLQIARNGKVKTAPRVRFPSNHWHPGVLQQKRVYHTLHAKVHTVKIARVGTETIELPGSADLKKTNQISTTRYRYEGGFDADVWYDEKLRWVRLTFNADDGSEIDYRCVNCIGS